MDLPLPLLVWCGRCEKVQPPIHQTVADQLAVCCAHCQRFIRWANEDGAEALDGD